LRHHGPGKITIIIDPCLEVNLAKPTIRFLKLLYFLLLWYISTRLVLLPRTQMRRRRRKRGKWWRRRGGTIPWWGRLRREDSASAIRYPKAPATNGNLVCYTAAVVSYRKVFSFQCIVSFSHHLSALPTKCFSPLNHNDIV
jgi:hypothetical protein